MKKHHRHENDCLNCGAALHGKFCQNCGQENLQLKENFGHLMVHAIGDYFHFDEKFFHTLRPLLFVPGRLTVDYNAGKRTQYLHPIRMYIFISLIYFLLFFKSGGEVMNVNEDGKKVNKEQLHKSINKKIDAKTDNTNDQKKVAKQLVDEGFAGSDFNYSKLSKNDTGTNTSIFGAHVYNQDTTLALYKKRQLSLPESKRDNFFQVFLVKKYFGWREQGKSATETFKEGIKHNFPKMMFFMLPVFAMLIRFAFWKNHKYYMEHLIYAFHLHCFIFLFLAIIIILKMVIPESLLSNGANSLLDFITFITIVWYVYKSLRLVYHRSRLATISKMFVVTFNYAIAFIFGITFLALIVAITSV